MILSNIILSDQEELNITQVHEYIKSMKDTPDPIEKEKLYFDTNIKRIDHEQL